MTADQALERNQPEVISTTGTVAIPDDAPRVFVRPSLNRDLASIMTLIFIIITYHIQHPTLLFRAQFGRSFRDEGLQEGVAIALLVSVVFMIGSWQERHTLFGRLRLAMVVGLGIYTVYVLVAIFLNTNPIHRLYDVTPEFLEEIFAEDTLLNTMKAANTMAIFGGAALASVIFLWSPWERGFTSLRNAGGVLALIFVWITYHIQSPLLIERSFVGRQFSSDGSQLIAAVLLLIGAAALMIQQNDPLPKLRYMRRAMMIVLGLYVLHVLAVVLTNYNIFLKYYAVNTDTYAELFVDGSWNTSLLALDRMALLAGTAFAAAVYLWSPWERLNLYWDAIRSNIAPLVIAIGALILWEGLIDAFKIEQFLLPKPSVIWTELKDIYPKLIAAGWFTFLNAIKGFIFGCGAGVLTGAVSARFSKFSTAVLPLAIAANSVPIIAFAPVMNFWFGVTSPNSKIAIVAVLCYFPAMISTVRGLTSVNVTQLELMRSYAASEWEIFRYLRVPNALPFVFSALKLSTTLAMIGAIVSEFFGGSLAGLGYRIREDAALFRFPESWSAIIVASVFGISFYLFISALERAAMPWYQSFRSES